MTLTLLHGDCRTLLPSLPAESVQCVVTSPPYWGLRDYGVDGQIGLEETPELFVATMVAVFREVWRVLRPDGTLWLNLGDSYAAPTKWGGASGNKNTNSAHGNYPRTRRGKTGFTSRDHAHVEIAPHRKPQPGLKPKDLVGMPWRVAFALQVDGWYLRSDIIWHKPNVMPESVTDRPTKAHEYLFLLTKSERYYYDADAIREPQTGNAHSRGRGITPKTVAESDRFIKAKESFHVSTAQYVDVPGGRNRRTVWTVPTQPTPFAHFATFPEKLIEPCILAGSKPGDTVLDPFFGSGTVGRMALRYGRQCIGIELNPSYIELSDTRTNGVQLHMEAL